MNIPALSFQAKMLIVAGIICAVLTDSAAVASLTFLSLDMQGDLYISQDEFALLDSSYTAAKLVGFMIVPWLFTRQPPLRCLRGATLCMALACALTLFTINLNALITLRILQGLSGGMIFVGGQTFLFRVFPMRQQVIVQAFFAIAAVIMPASMTPFLQGWMIDNLSWPWFFALAVALGAIALIAFAGVDEKCLKQDEPVRLDLFALVLFGIFAVCFTHVVQQGSRWNWWEAQHITFLTAIALAAIVIFVIMQIKQNVGKNKQNTPFINGAVFADGNFAFAFLIAFVAGIILLSTSYIIPNFSLNVLSFSATAAGQLLAFGSLTCILSILLIIFLILKTKIPPMLCAPLGIVFIMLALWLLSGSTSDSGVFDMLPAVMLRAAGLGLLFLPMTLMALSGLKGALNTQGAALFNTLRQVGGMFGIALLQTYIERQKASNSLILSSHLNDGNPIVSERLSALTSMLQGQGIETSEAAKMAMGLLNKSVTLQVSTLSFNNAFIAVILVFAFAFPSLILWKMILAKIQKRQNDRLQPVEAD